MRHGCALVWHVQPRVVIFPCRTHYRPSSVNCSAPISSVEQQQTSPVRRRVCAMTIHSNITSELQIPATGHTGLQDPYITPCNHSCEVRRDYYEVRKSSISTFTFYHNCYRTRSSAIADASCQLKSCQLPRNSAETTCTTRPELSISCR